MTDAINFYRSNDRETIEIMSTFSGTKDPPPLKDSYEFRKRLFLQPPYPSYEGFKTVLTEIHEPALDQKKLSPDLFFDKNLLDEIKGK